MLDTIASEGIEKIAEMILSDNISLDTQDQNVLKKYYDFVILLIVIKLHWHNK